MIELQFHVKNANPSEEDDDFLTWLIVVNSDVLPWQIFDSEMELYVFTKLPEHKPENRAAGRVAWEGKTGPEYVVSGNGEKIGKKRNFRFNFPSEEGMMGRECFMTEYSLLDSEDDDDVLCVIKKRVGSKTVESGKRKYAMIDELIEEEEDQSLEKKTKSNTASSSSVAAETEFSSPPMISSAVDLDEAYCSSLSGNSIE